MPEVEVAKDDSQNTALLNLLIFYFKASGVLLLVWFIGYFEFSASWILIGLFIYLFNEKFRKRKAIQIEIAHELAKNEKESILTRVEDLPSWVYFPDTERAEWLNKILEQMWPFIGDYATAILHDSVEPKIIESMPDALKSFKFSKIYMGSIPPRIGGIKSYVHNVKRNEVIIDLDLIFFSDAEFQVAIRAVTAGIKDLQIRGTLRVILRPLIPKTPLIGGVTVFFLTNPNIDFNLTSLANAFDIPGLSDLLRKIVTEQVANFLVLPNRYVLPLASDIDINKLSHPLPQGCLRINVIEAKDLKSADVSLVGKGKSDPYVIVCVGAQRFKTKVINNQLNPVWNAIYEAIVDTRRGQKLQFEVFDEDPGNNDDFLGRGEIDIQSVADKGTVNTWLHLEDIEKGMIHMQLTWLYLSPDPSVLDQIKEALYQVRKGKQTEDTLATALLVVYLDSAKNLPLKNKMKEPTPVAVLTSGNTVHESKVPMTKPETQNPKWEENFKFLITDPNVQNLDVEIKDKKSDKRLGIMYVPLKLLLTEPNMTQEQPFVLRESGPNSTVQMRIVMRILTPDMPSLKDFVNEAEDLMKQDSSEEESEEEDSPAVTPAASPSKPLASSTPMPKPARKESELERVASAVENGVKDELITPTNAENNESQVRRRKTTQPKDHIIHDSTMDSGGLGRVQLTLRYSKPTSELKLVASKCQNLVATNNEDADPYLKFHIVPDKLCSKKHKTKVQKNNLNPIFDESFEFKINYESLNDATLVVTVKNDVSIFSKHSKYLGTVSIPLSDRLTTATTEWYDLRDYDDDDNSIGSRKSLVETTF